MRFVAANVLVASLRSLRSDGCWSCSREGATGKPLGTSGLSLAKRGPRVDHGPVRWQDNPLYRPNARLERGRAVWVWRAFQAAVLAALMIIGSYGLAGVYAAVFLIAEVVRLRSRRRSPSAGEHTSEPGEDR
jgi:hypothetical protein